MNNSALRYEDAPARRAAILAGIPDTGFTSITELVREFAVSHMTIRRDLRHLEAAGRVRVVHGGVVRAFGERPAVETDGDDDGTGIALRAVEMVGDTDVIASRRGRSTVHAGPPCHRPLRGTSVSHSLPVLGLLAGRPARCRVIRSAANSSAAAGVCRRAGDGGGHDPATGATVFLSVAAVDAHGCTAAARPRPVCPASTDDIADNVVACSRREDLLNFRARLPPEPGYPVTAWWSRKDRATRRTSPPPCSRCGAEVAFVGGDSMTARANRVSMREGSCGLVGGPGARAHELAGDGPMTRSSATGARGSTPRPVRPGRARPRCLPSPPVPLTHTSPRLPCLAIHQDGTTPLIAGDHTSPGRGRLRT